jgi:hypothetical protein
VNPDRLICGLATLFGTMAHSGVFWTARMFEGWLRSPITALPLRVNHSVLAIERGGLVITNVGTCRMFATAPPRQRTHTSSGARSATSTPAKQPAALIYRP